MLRVAVICVHTSPLAQPGTPDCGGMNTYVRELSRQLSQRHIHVDIFTRQVSTEESLVVRPADGYRIIPIKAGPCHPLPKSQVYDFLPEFARNVAEFQLAYGPEYDLIHSHYWLSGWVGEALKQRWLVPHITMFHTFAAAKHSFGSEEDDSAFRLETESQIAAAADVVVAASQHEKALIKHLCGEEDRHVAVIPCGVDLDLFQPIDMVAAKAKLRLSASRVVLFVGRLVPLKGVDILIEAFARLSSIPDLQLLIVGGEGKNDPNTRRLKWLAEELEIEETVRFEGPVDHTSLPVYYSAADVCVVPSHYESFGLVAIEALACGTPVIASQVGGLPSIVLDGHNGLLVPWRCPQVFADKIRTILTDEHLVQQLRPPARESVTHLTWPRVAEEIETLYRTSLMKNSRYLNVKG